LILRMSKIFLPMATCGFPHGISHKAAVEYRLLLSMANIFTFG
jgi:hypothetical protein